MEIEYRCADGDLVAFADLHLHKPAVDAKVRRSVLYGYAGFVLLLAWLYFRFGPVEFAIVLLLVGPIVIGWLKTTTNSFSGGLYYVAGCALVASIAILLLRTAPRAAKLGAPAR